MDKIGNAQTRIADSSLSPRTPPKWVAGPHPVLADPRALIAFHYHSSFPEARIAPGCRASHCDPTPSAIVVRCAEGERLLSARRSTPQRRAKVSETHSQLGYFSGYLKLVGRYDQSNYSGLSRSVW